MTAKNTKPKINELDYNNKDKIYVNNKGYKFKIIDKKSECSIAKSGNKKWTTKYLVKFNSGYETWSDSKEIGNGSIKDWLSPYVCGVGIVGIEIDHPQSHYLYDRWRNMLRRCYDKDCNLYHIYGGSGVIVCDEWKYFPNFVRDIENKENCEKFKDTHSNPKDRYELDKDLIKKGNKVYCNEYTCIVPHDINMKERNERNNYNRDINSIPILQFDFSFNFIKKHESIAKATKSLGMIHCSGIIANCKGKQLYANGYFWRYFDESKSTDAVIEEIKLEISKYYNSCNNRLKSQLKNIGIDLKQCGIKENK